MFCSFVPPKPLLQQVSLLCLLFIFHQPLWDNIIVCFFCSNFFCPVPFFMFASVLQRNFLTSPSLVFIFGCLVLLLFIFEYFVFHDWCFSFSFVYAVDFLLCFYCVCCFLCLCIFCVYLLCMFLLVFCFVFVVSVVVVSDYAKKRGVFPAVLLFVGYGWCKANFGPHVLLLSAGNLTSPKTYQHKRVKKRDAFLLNGTPRCVRPVLMGR